MRENEKEGERGQREGARRREDKIWRERERERDGKGEIWREGRAKGRWDKKEKNRKISKGKKLSRSQISKNRKSEEN